MLHVKGFTMETGDEECDMVMEELPFLAMRVTNDEKLYQKLRGLNTSVLMDVIKEMFPQYKDSIFPVEMRVKINYTKGVGLVIAMPRVPGLSDDELYQFVMDNLQRKEIPWKSLNKYKKEINRIITKFRVYKVKHLGDIFNCKGITGKLVKKDDDYFILTEDDLSEIFRECDEPSLTAERINEYPEMLISDDISKLVV